MQIQARLEIPFVPLRRTYGEAQLYLSGGAFAFGNLVLPLLVHAIPNGGLIFLPLFFYIGGGL